MFAVLEGPGIEGVGVEVTEVKAAAVGFGDAGGEEDLDARGFDSVFEGPDAFDMGGVGEDTPGFGLEAVPLFKEVVAGVVADAEEGLLVGLADAVEVGGVDDDASAGGDGGFGFVHAFAGGPEFVVHGGADGEDGVGGGIDVADVEAGGVVGGAGPGVFDVASVECGEVFSFHDHADGFAAGGDHGGGAVDDGAHGGVFVADDAGVGDDGAEPVEEVEDFGSADAGEEVFVSTAEACDFVGEDGAEDDEEVVVVDDAVDVDFDIDAEEVVGEGGDVGSGDDADGGEVTGVVPGMVEEADVAEGSGALGGSDAEVFEDGGFGEGGMGAESNDDINAGGTGGEGVVQGMKEEGKGTGAGAVGNDEEDALAIDVPGADGVEGLGKEGFVHDGTMPRAGVNASILLSHTCELDTGRRVGEGVDYEGRAF